MFCDDSVRIPWTSERKAEYQRACKCLEKPMTQVSRDLFKGLIKAVRQSQAWPGCLEAPDYYEVIEASLKSGLPDGYSR